MSESGALFDLTGKTALVTGASSGLGRQAARILLEAGAQVVGLARRNDALRQLQSEVGADFSPISIDLGAVSDYDAVAQVVSEPFGPPDIVVHAAGINLREPADDVSFESWDATLHLNLSIPFFLSRALVSCMKERHWGKIITFASLQTFRAFPNSIPYGASKGGVGQLTRAMAEEWSRYGISVNAIAPGFFPTELTQPVFENEEIAQRNAAQTCFGRNGSLEDINGPILFLASRASDYVTGQILMVDGGFTAK